MTGAGGQRPQRKDRSSVQSAFQQVPVSGKEREPQLAQEEELDLHPGPRPPAHPRVVWCLEWPEVEGGSGSRRGELSPAQQQPRSASCGRAPGIPQGSGWRLPARTQKCLCPRGLLPLLSLLTSEPLVLEQTPQGLPRAGRIRFQRRLWGVGGAFLSVGRFRPRAADGRERLRILCPLPRAATARSLPGCFGLAPSRAAPSRTDALSAAVASPRGAVPSRALLPRGPPLLTDPQGRRLEGRLPRLRPRDAAA